MSEKEILRVDVRAADRPEAALFKCAMAISTQYEMCIVCLIESLGEGARQMLKAGVLSHGMAAEDIVLNEETIQ